MAEAFFPLTIPFTTGPGTITAAISLGTNRPTDLADLILFVLGVTTAFAAVAASVALLYGFADRIVDVLGPSRASALMRLSTFALSASGGNPRTGSAGCIGVSVGGRRRSV